MNFEKELNIILKNLNEKKYEKVIHRCKNLIELKLDNSIIYNIYGLALQSLRNYKGSIEAFKKSIKLQKNNLVAMNNLAVSLKATFNYEYAEKMYAECLKINPDYISAIINYANLKRELNNYDGAIKLYLKSLKYEKNSNKLQIYFNLAELYRIIGDFKNANIYAQKIVNESPNNVYGHKLLSEFIDYEKDDKHLLQLENIFNKTNLKIVEKIELAFVIGKAYEKIKNYETAFKYFKIGNDLKKTIVKYNYSDHLKLHNSLITFFKKINLEKINKKKINKKVIFVCGMPRSGTTLVEQIISSHSEVLATGENNFISNYVNKNYLNKFEILNDKLHEELHADENILQKEFFNSLNVNKSLLKVYTDKTVQNFLWIGFIHIFFPNSKIIITERNAKAICLSIYKINFQSGFMNFAYDQKDITNFYKLYSELIEFWKEYFPNKFYIAKYEKLVDEPIKEIKKIIKFCDLKWDSNCLKHYENKSPIKTASMTQARKPIYNSSKNLSDNYSVLLKEMFEKLNK